MALSTETRTVSKPLKSLYRLPCTQVHGRVKLLATGPRGPSRRRVDKQEVKFFHYLCKHRVQDPDPPCMAFDGRGEQALRLWCQVFAEESAGTILTA